MNIIILGPPGSGKGTQGIILAKKFGLFYFESGDFARELAKKNSRIKSIVEKGELIPEKEMTAYVNSFLEKHVNNWRKILFDGYPRFVNQFIDLKNFLKTKRSKIDKAILLDVSDKIIISRLSSRRMCEVCGKSYNLITNPSNKKGICDKCGGRLIQRTDDKTKVIMERLNEYRQNVKPLVDYLGKKGLLFKVNGAKSISEITLDILKQFKKEKFDA